jgi:LPXTG-motif cell wall-anchored protein
LCVRPDTSDHRAADGPADHDAHDIDIDDRGATLPFTGGSSIPLGLSGLGLVLVGSSLLALRRRKPVE